MLLNIEHQTQYIYSKAVQYTIQQLRLTPRDGMGQQVKHWEIKVNGQCHAFEDTYGNLTHTLVIDEPHHELLISVAGEVETGVAGLACHQPLPVELYLRESPLTQADAAMTAFAKQFARASLADMMHALRDKMHYIKGATQVNTPAAEAFQLGKGVCQDHAHAFIGCCRSLGLPARYVSGYLFTEDGSLMQTHAWVDVWQNDQWLGLDVSNGILTNETHVRLATGLDYRSASPVTGTRIGGGKEGMSSVVSVNQSALTHEQRKQHHDQLYQQAILAQQ
ncbi:MAG TPA: transglutaminase family protein [Methylophilus sp.]|uniref:transglutaminase family protein n=1 Tax=Methylophilus sp. TaxID=29541 RepID=UPI002CB05105|nr:transglutaminase family protein [Methylophilus sp.]HSH87332.1 transglutaminase family protein [Methylophilus sp.]